jgi:hypothetical protein
MSYFNNIHASVERDMMKNTGIEESLKVIQDLKQYYNASVGGAFGADLIAINKLDYILKQVQGLITTTDGSGRPLYDGTKFQAYVNKSKAPNVGAGFIGAVLPGTVTGLGVGATNDEVYNDAVEAMLYDIRRALRIHLINNKALFLWIRKEKLHEVLPIPGLVTEAAKASSGES